MFNQYSRVNQFENEQISIEDEEDYRDEDAFVDAEQIAEQHQPSSHLVNDVSHLPFYTKHEPCTDFAFLFLFLCFIVILCIVYSGTHFKWTPQPKSLLYPTDLLGRSCGSQNKKHFSFSMSRSGDNDDKILKSVNTLSVPYIKACQRSVYSDECQQQVLQLFQSYPNKEQFYDLRDKPFLYYLNSEKPSKYGGICVSYCPGMKKDASYCPPELDRHTENGTETGKCSYVRPDGKIFVEESNQLQFRTVLNRCIPTTQSLQVAHFAPTADVMKSYANMLPPVLTESIAHVVRQWKIILLSMIASLFLGFAFVVVIRLFAKFFIWFIVVSVFTLLFLGSTLSLLEAMEWRQKYFPSTAIESNENFYYYSSKLSTQMYGLIAACLGMLFFVYTGFLYVHLKNVNRAVGIMREAARAVSSVPQLMLFSVGMFLVLILFYMYWFLMSVNIWSSGATVVEEENTIFSFNSLMRSASIIHLFAFFWISQFISAFTMTAASNVICQWYFSTKQTRNIIFLTMPVLRGACTVLFYNLGSVAFGSLVVGTVKFLSFVLRRMVRNVERTMKNQRFLNIIASILAWIVRGLIAIFNKIVNTITKHAYIQVAIYGTGFMESSRNAISLLKNHTAQILILDWIVDWVLFCGKVCVAGITCYCAYWMSLIIPSSTGKVEPTSNFSLILLALIFFTSFRIASLFLNIYEIATDTIIHCYLIDEQLCNTDPSRRMYCSTELLGLMEFERQINEEVLKMNGEDEGMSGGEDVKTVELH